MKVADFAALSLAENNADAVSWYVPLSPLSDEDWQTVVRGVRHYEQAVQRHLGWQVDRSVWVGDTYVMYGEDGPLETGPGYAGVRRRRQYPAGWWPCVLADRGKEASRRRVALRWPGSRSCGGWCWSTSSCLRSGGSRGVPPFSKAS